MGSNFSPNNQSEIANVNREDSLSELVAIREDFEQYSELLYKMNEAETRLLLIDRILTRVLGWNPESFKPETHISNLGYIDYLLSVIHQYIVL